jgi:Fanconi anemia group M protein
VLTLALKQPDLFGEDTAMQTGKKKRTRVLRRPRTTKTKSRYSDPSLWSVIDNDEKMRELEAQLDEEYQNTLAETQRLAKNLGFEIAIKKEDNNYQPQLFIKHSMLAEYSVEARWYALAIVKQAKGKNSIVLLPTGLGKTYLVFLLLPEILANQPDKKILILCPTKPLCLQHWQTLQKVMPKLKAVIINGQIAKKKRPQLWRDNQVIIATPQTITAEVEKNSGVGSYHDLSFLVIDEIHHATGRHDYVKLGEYYCHRSPETRILCLTASPDPRLKTIISWQKILNVADSQVIARSFNCPDVLPYVHYRKITPHFIKRKLSDLQNECKDNLAKLLTCQFKAFDSELKESAEPLAYRNDEKLVVGLRIGELKHLLDRIAKAMKYPEKMEKAARLLSRGALMIAYCAGIKAVNNGAFEFAQYLQRQFYRYVHDRAEGKNTPKFLFKFCSEPGIQKMVIRLYEQRLWRGDLPIMIKTPVEKASDTKAWQVALVDEKLPCLLDLVEKSTYGQVLIFTNSRDTLRKVRYYLTSKMPDKAIGILTGTQAKLHDPGMSQKEQINTLNKFHQNEIDILISTSIGEEGLDFPSVDTVIFFEPIADVRRYVQRLGRTARHRDGKVHILVFRDSDEYGIYFVIGSREKRIREIIKHFQKLSQQ